MPSKAVLAEVERINGWMTGLKQSGLNVRSIDKRKAGQLKWRVQMIHRLASYWIEVTAQGKNLNFVAVLLRFNNNNTQEISRLALRLNNKLVSSHIAVQSGCFVLKQSTLNEDISERRFYRDLTNFHQVHEYVYGELVKKARQLK